MAMTEYRYNVIKTAYSLRYYNDVDKRYLTTDELRDKVEWLKVISVEGVDRYLFEGERTGLIKSRCRDGSNEIEYRTTKHLETLAKMLDI